MRQWKHYHELQYILCSLRYESLCGVMSYVQRCYVNLTITGLTWIWLGDIFLPLNISIGYIVKVCFILGWYCTSLMGLTQFVLRTQPWLLSEYILKCLCFRCGNVNWARRMTCNMCNSPKFGKVEQRTGKWSTLNPTVCEVSSCHGCYCLKEPG